MDNLNIILIAPPAAGKGTLAKMVNSKYNLPHISIGDILRTVSSDGTERGKSISETMAKGDFVSDEIILELLEERLQQNDCNNGYILDGFPRNIEQALQYEKVLEKLNKNLGYVFYLEVDKDTAMKRTLGRLSCPKCGSIYNEFSDEMKPKNNGVCDKCNSSLSRRSDDNAETFENRFDMYMKKTQPLIDFYKEKDNLYRIDSSLGKENTFEQIEKIIRGNI